MPSAFEVLMTSRTAAKKKTPQITTLSQSRKKRKVEQTPDDEPVKKPRWHTPSSAEDSDRIALMKSKIGLLNKKPCDFDPEKVSCWEKGESVPFVFLCLAFDLINTNSTGSSRIGITDVLCNMLRTVIATSPKDLVPTVFLAANEIAPAHEGVEMGIGQGSLINAVSEAFGTSVKQVVQQSKQLGDLGLAAKGCRSSQTMISKPEPLTVVKVFNTFQLIAKETGTGSVLKKKNRMKELLVATTDCEPLYLTRLLQAKLRLGFSGQTVLAALGQAAVYHSKPPPTSIKNPLQEAAKIVKQVFSVLPVYDIIVPALLTGGVWNLPITCNFTPGIPVRPMLANAVTSIALILNKFKDTTFTCEYKYDGERAQIHYMEDGTIEIFSRNGERHTNKYPEVAPTLLSRSKKPSVKSFILDCEFVAFDRYKKKFLPLQVLSTRARKNVNVHDIKVDVCIFAFDILYLNGQLLIQENLNIRREKLYSSFEQDPGYFQFATALTSSNVDEIQEFLDASVDIGCEGLIIKTVNSDATYEPAKRSNNWLKLKKDYMDSIGDSVDLVPIAAFHGQGKRTGKFGAFLLACYDVDKKKFQSICKIATGFTDAVLQERTTSLSSKVIAAPKINYQVDDSLSPDVWFEPAEVWEVKAADLTISPVHRAAIGIVDRHKGISLRFPRLVRVRQDKKPEEATSSVQVAELYKAQKHNHPSDQVNCD